MKRVYAGVSALALATAFAGTAAMAQTEDGSVEAVIVTGTRTTGLRAVDSPAPVQVLGNDALKRVGQPDLIQSLAQNLPSIQAQAFGGDQAAFHTSFKLRGLNPNHTLVLLNGKRRHGTANVVPGGGSYGGNAAADISLIPVGSIDHVEVLQQGAAAQYGTDAIAGVINIIQKTNSHGGEITATGGHYFDQGGQTGDLSVNLGIEPFDKAYLNLTAETKYRGFSFRGDFDPRVTTDTASGRSLLALYPQIVNFPNYPYVNRVRGDTEYRYVLTTFNAGYDFNDSLSFYTFGSYGWRWGQAYENYRTPNIVVGRNVSTVNGVRVGDIPFPGGFQPKESTEEDDYAITGGFKGTAAGWSWDFATSFGHDLNAVYVLNSANQTLYFDTSTATQKGFSPATYHDGDFENSQWTTTLDVTREFDVGFAKPMTVAAGLEYRQETYSIHAGDPASYYGTGAQSFFGYSPVNASKNKRDDISEYLDIAINPTNQITLDGAVRHENYSDFGTTTVFKLTGRYDFNEAFAIRATGSTGFRAPTLAEEYYSGINVGPTSVSGVFAPNSPGAAFLGLSGLGPEKSKNFSAGIVAHPISRLTVTLDAYTIKLTDRIIQSATFTGYNSNVNVVRSPSVLLALAANGVAIDPNIYTGPSGSVGVVSFVNGIDTRTSGADFVATYSTNFDTYGRIDWSVSGAYVDTKVLRVAPPPPNVAQSVKLLDFPGISSFEQSTPRWRATAGANWSWNKLNVNLRESFYGGNHSYSQDPIGAGFVKLPIKSAFITDLEVSYQLLKPIKLAIGANNLFNKYPNKNLASYRAAQLATTSSGYASSLYPTDSPFGFNGGFYYFKATATF